MWGSVAAPDRGQEDAGAKPAPELRPGELAERVFRTVSRTAHEHAAVDQDEEVFVSPPMEFEQALRRGYGSDLLPGTCQDDRAPPLTCRESPPAWGG
jgi:hypothetical protein